MGYCGNCGEKIEKGANFCGKCGAVVEKEQSEHVYDVIAPKNNSARVWKIIIPILKNNDRYLFDWKSDAGASEGSIFAMGTGAYFVQVFSGILDKDGASWSQLIDSFYLKMDSYDRKYAESFARMFCTYSDEELTLNAKAMKEKMKPFNGDNWVAKSIKKVDDIIDDNIGDLSKKTADLKKRIDVENGTSVAKFNKSYQELDKMCNTADYFSNMTDPFLTASKEFKNVTSFLDVFYKISEVIGYASEFKNQDEFAVKSLDTLIKKSDSSCVMSKAMKDSMGDYKKTLETDIVAYSAYNYLMNNMTDLFTDTIDISTTILDMDSKLYLLAWDIAKGAIPLVKNSLSNTDCFLQSMYAGIIQSDTFSTYINKRNVVFGDAKNITPENLYELSQYCYASLSFMYGSGLTQYGADLEIDENGDFSFYIGIGLGGKGVCSIEDDHLNYNINMYEENQNVQDTMLIGKDKKYLVMKDINDNSYNLYWIRKGSQSVYSEVEEENVGKDEIELSGYIGENISQIDQNIKFTIENEVDAGKFKQNDNVCFACHKDDSIREIDITGNGGYMLYGIKYNMDVDSVRTILSKSDIWTIQNDQTDTIFCKDKSNTYYFDIYLENGSVKSLSLHSADSYCGYNHAE